jgi:hypothetical protein
MRIDEIDETGISEASLLQRDGFIVAQEVCWC